MSVQYYNGLTGYDASETRFFHVVGDEVDTRYFSEGFIEDAKVGDDGVLHAVVNCVSGLRYINSNNERCYVSGPIYRYHWNRPWIEYGFDSGLASINILDDGSICVLYCIQDFHTSGESGEYFSPNIEVYERILPRILYMDPKGPESTRNFHYGGEAPQEPECIFGVGADGKTPVDLFYRVNAGTLGKIIFEIDESNGILSIGDGGSFVYPPDEGTPIIKNESQGIEEYNGHSYAHVRYYPPKDFVRNDSNASIDSTLKSRNIYFRVRVGNSEAIRQRHALTLLRPPVVLVHGLWGKSDTWNYLGDVLRKTNDLVFQPDYNITSSEHFSRNADFIARQLRIACAAGWIQYKYVMRQADVVAHSMGGCITRWYSEDLSQDDKCKYRDNIHKFITLNTPHAGSQLANVAMSCFSDTVSDLLKEHGWDITKGAVEDLAVDSEAMNRLNVLNVKNNSDIPSYSIEGRSEWDSLALTKEEYWLYHVLALAVAFDADSWYEVPASLAKYPFMFALGELSLTGNELLGVPNDRIVGGESQRGGIEEGSTQWFNVPFHCCPNVNRTIATVYGRYHPECYRYVVKAPAKGAFSRRA